MSNKDNTKKQKDYIITKGKIKQKYIVNIYACNMGTHKYIKLITWSIIEIYEILS